MLDQAATLLVRRRDGVATLAAGRLGQSVALGLLIFSFLAFNGRWLLQDSDTFWHIVVGRQILASRSFPQVDTFSHTMSGARWIAKEWLSQIVFALAYDWDGWFGVCAVTALVAASTFAYLFWWLSRRLVPVAALTVTAVAMSLTIGSMLARPQVFFFLLTALTVCGLTDAVETRRTPWRLAPLAVLWANLHASFPILFVFAGLFALDAVVEAGPERRLRVAINWTAAIAVAALATGATPYGYEPLLVSIRLFGHPDISYIDEWRPMGLNSRTFYALAYLAGALTILAASRPPWPRFGPLVVCGALMARHVRFIAMFGLVAAAAVARPMAMRLPRFAARDAPAGRATRAISTAALALGCVAAVAALTLSRAPAPPARIAPADAVAAAERFGVKGPVFNDYALGGYLIFIGVKPFIDGRAELYFDSLFPQLREAETGGDDEKFLNLLDRYGVAWALTMPGSAGTGKFERSAAWKKIYEGEDADVFVKTSS